MFHNSAKAIEVRDPDPLEPRPVGPPDPAARPPRGGRYRRRRHAEMDREFDALLTEISASGELVSAEALGDPASSTCSAGADGHLATDGPYAETKEQLAGFFVVDCATRDAGRGDRRPLRPARRHRRAPAGDVAGRRRPVTAGGVEDVWRECCAARPGRAGPPVRRLRRRRGRRPGGAAGRLRGSGPDDGVPRQPAGLAGHGGLAAAGGPLALERAGPSARSWSLARTSPDRARSGAATATTR